MSVADNYSPVVVAGTASTISFPWVIPTSAWLVVESKLLSTGAKVVLTEGADYTVALSESGGIVTITTPLGALYNYIASMQVPLTQETPYSTSKGFQGKVTENSFDKLTRITQQQSDDLDRSLKFAVGVTGVNAEIPTLEANKMLLVNTAGDGFVLSEADFTDIEANLNIVAGIADDVTAVANNESNINAVSSNATNINIVAGSITNVNNVGNNIAAVIAVDANETNINAVAADLTNINNASTYATNAHNSEVAAAASAATATAQAAKLSGTSSTSITIGTGTKVFTTQADKDFNGNNVRVYSSANSANYMDGLATYSGTSLSVDVAVVGGSGTFTDWIIKVNGARGATGAAGSVTDGDKGDITVSSSGTVWTVDNGAITEAKITLADNTTNNVSTTKHGFVPKAPNDANQYLNGLGAWATVASGGGFITTDTIATGTNWDGVITDGISKTTGTYTYTAGCPLMGLAHEGILIRYKIAGDTNHIFQKWIDMLTGEEWIRSTINGGTTWVMWEKSIDIKSVNRFEEKLPFIRTESATLSTNSIINGYTLDLVGTATSVDFVYTNIPWGVTATNRTSSHNVMILSTGSTSSGRAAFKRGYPGGISLQSGAYYRQEIKINVGALSTSAQRYVLSFGEYTKSSPAIAVNFSHTDNANSGNWICSAGNGTVQTVVNTSVAPKVSANSQYNATTEQKLRIEVEGVTVARFYIDDVLVATINTNLSTGTYMNFNDIVSILKSVGSTPSTCAVADYKFQFLC